MEESDHNYLGKMLMSLSEKGMWSFDNGYSIIMIFCKLMIMDLTLQHVKLISLYMCLFYLTKWISKIHGLCEQNVDITFCFV